MNDKRIYQNSSKKRPQKNYRGCFRDYCCIPGCQSAFYDGNRVKTDIKIFKFPDSALRKKWRQVIKRYRRIGGADKFSKVIIIKSWFANFILTQSKLGYLWE